MITRVVMPLFHEGINEATIVKWFKKEGEEVKKGEPLVEVMIEKFSYELEAPESGILFKTLAKEESIVSVGTLLAVIAKKGEKIPEIETLVKPDEKVEESPVIEEKVTKRVKTFLRASPAAKKLAKEHRVDLTKVTPTGPKGRIIARDIEKFLEETLVSLKVKEVIPLKGIRKLTAERMTSSAQTPQVTLITEVDFSEAIKIRGEILKKAKSKVSYTDILLKAASKALEEHPLLNAALEEDEIKVFEEINIGIAVASPKGLVVPVICEANKKSVTEIASLSGELILKAREGHLSSRDLSRGTFTITNLGMYEIDAFTPIINPPQSAILAVGKIGEKPVVLQGKVAIRSMVLLSLSFDHRVMDGAVAGQFLQRLKQILEDPHSLLLI